MAATPDRLPGAAVESESRLRLTELDRDWALRRLELFKSLDGSVQQSMGTMLEVTTRVLQTADELRREMEGQASDLVAQLRAEREALVQEIEAHRRQRDGLAAEMAALRRGADEEIARARREAETDAAGLRERAEAETAGRRREAAEAASARQSQAEREIAAARQQAEAEIATLRQQAEAERDAVLGEAHARRLALLGEIHDLEEQLGAVAAQLQAMVTRRAPGAGLPSPAAPATGPVSRKAAARLVGDARAGSETRSDPAPSGTATGVATALPPDPPDPRGPNRGVTTPEARAAGRPGGTAVATRSTRARITVRHITAFSSALELQRSIQHSRGVHDVQALQFEHGTLVLAVEHDPDLDLADAISQLPIQTEMLARSSGDLELTISPG